MGLPAEIKSLYLSMLKPESNRQIVLPAVATGIGVTATSGAANVYGVWVDLAPAAAVTADTLIVGVAVDTPSGAEVFTIDIGSCLGYANAAAVIAAGAAAVAAAHRAECRVEIATDAGGYVQIPLPYPVWIPSGVGILARLETVSGADTLNISAVCLQGMS
jgi:hypothetical protein